MTNADNTYIMEAYKGKRKCQMENENEDSQKTKLSENGMLCIGQKGSQKDLALFPKNCPAGVDKSTKHIKI